jgi:hypothetical protein
MMLAPSVVRRVTRADAVLPRYTFLTLTCEMLPYQRV